MIARRAGSKQQVFAAEPTLADRRRHANLVSLFFVVGVVQTAPAVRELLLRHFAAPGTLDSPLWLQGVLLIAILEFAVALSLMRVVDYAALWVLSMLALAIAMSHAYLLALILFARQGTQLAALDLSDAARGATLPWISLLLLSAHAVVAWVLGRAATRQQSESNRRLRGS
jgi:hypothetical protein